jgi:hypothetical protein
MPAARNDERCAFWRGSVYTVAGYLPMKETLISKDALAQKLRALQNMTVANGCTESEAVVAADKAAELLERYGLSLEELKAAAPDHLCDSDSVHCGRRHTHEAQFVAPKIAEFTKTKIWLSRTRTEVRLTFFGLKADVQIASYLFNVFRIAMETEWAVYWASHKEEHHSHGKTVRKSFLMGMTKRLDARLSALIEAAQSGPTLSESRELIVLKAQIVEKAFRDLNLRLRKNRPTTTAGFDSRAYAAGQRAGEKVSFSSGAIENRRSA